MAFGVYDRSKMSLRGVAAWVKAKIQGRDATFIQVKELPVELWPDRICNTKQFEMYKAINDFRDKYGYMPTYAEMVSWTGRAIATVQKRFRELEELGLIKYHGARAIEVMGSVWIKPLPLQYMEENPNEFTEFVIRNK